MLDLDPDLGSRLGERDREQARQRCSASIVHVSPGEWKLPSAGAGRRDDVFALVIVDGILCRGTAMGRHDTLELLCDGDVLLLQEPAVEPALIRTSVSLTAVTTLTVMVLGELFLRCADRWPALHSAVRQRLAAQQHRLADQTLALQLPRAEHRILVTLWLLAERCGYVTPDGVTLPLGFTHEALSRMTGARRPTVSLALTRLRETGSLVILGDGRLVLTAVAQQKILSISAPVIDRSAITTGIHAKAPRNERTDLVGARSNGRRSCETPGRA